MVSIKRTAAACTAICLAAASFPASAAGSGDEYLPLNRNRTDCVYSDQQNTAYASCNDVYYDAWSGSKGSYLAYDLSAFQPEKINVAWYSGAWNNYDYTVLNESAGASLSAYKIYVNAAEGGAYPETGWEEKVSVQDYTAHSGQNLLDFTGYHWVKLEVCGVQNGGTTVSLNVDIHDCSAGAPDSWIFYGDSITAGGMVTFSAGDGNFADFVHRLDPRHYPAQENGGIGGIFSTTGKANIDRWLKQFPGTYVSIAYGTNDCWGNQTGAERYYENTVYMIEAVQKAGKTAVLPKIPYSTEPGITPYIGDYNAQIDRIYREYPDVIQGPDFYAWFQEHPEGLSADGVHPNADGYNEMRRLWAETAVEAIYSKAADPAACSGDVNADGKNDAADAELLAAYLTGKGTLPAGWKNADLNGDGRLHAGDLTLLKRLILMKETEDPVMTQPVLLD
ncbi:MAG TPA: lysophospholipase [Ruminococcus sp.]|nr:lysophospholipase [Ruminococcus sp.]